MKYLVGIIFFSGIIYFQLKLSRNKNKYLGLILPVGWFVFSLIYLVVALPASQKIQTMTEVQIVSVNHEENAISNEKSKIVSKEIGDYKSSLIITLLNANIFTLILITSYIVQRIHMGKKKQLLIMKANDL